MPIFIGQEGPTLGSRPKRHHVHGRACSGGLNQYVALPTGIWRAEMYANACLIAPPRPQLVNAAVERSVKKVRTCLPYVYVSAHGAGNGSHLHPNPSRSHHVHRGSGSDGGAEGFGVVLEIERACPGNRLDRPRTRGNNQDVHARAIHTPRRIE